MSAAVRRTYDHRLRELVCESGRERLAVAGLARHVAFYVPQHNSVIPHSALGGLTPDEVYFGTGTEVRERLADAWRSAREDRHAVNRAASCGRCSPGPEVEHDPRIPIIPSGMQLHPQESRMSS